MSGEGRSLESIARDGWLEAMVENAPPLGSLSALLGRESLGLLILARVELVGLRRSEDGELFVGYRSAERVEEKPFRELMAGVIEGLLEALRREQASLAVIEGTGEEMFGQFGCFLAALYGLSLKMLFLNEDGAELELELMGERRRIRYATFYPLLEASLGELGARLEVR